MKIVIEGINIEAEHSFVCRHSIGSTFDCPYHSHPEYEITLIASGSGCRLVGDHFGHFESGDLIIHGPHLPHMYQSWKSHSDIPQSKYIQFDPIGLGFFKFPELRKIRSMLEQSERGLLFPKYFSEETEHYLDRMINDHGPTRISLFIELLDNLSKNQTNKQLASIGYQLNINDEKTQRLERILAYIQNNYHLKLELNDVAKIACLHPQSFSRFFKNHMGKPFQIYVNELRLSHSTRELIREEKSITEIAFDSGFTNLSNFNRLFKRQYGVSPTDYLKQLH